MKYSTDVLTAVCFQNTDFWIVMPFNLVGEYQRFGKICYLHLQGRLESNSTFLKNLVHCVITHKIKT